MEYYSCFLFCSHLVRDVAGNLHRPPPWTVESNQMVLHLTAQPWINAGEPEENVTGKRLVVRLYGSSHLFCMKRCFRHGGRWRPSLFNDRFAISLVTGPSPSHPTGQLCSSSSYN
ncbi:unnamed protein product [Fraxinus pennsylvanica]|uniref:Uncharacterized protein n=1 Tax=Fraxinus pennsylvanica TaxID=56036 RepID=A0AAD1ZZV4_9LAMI|nr:unnamed protein product [Fraxinus pennsylvanica]